MSTLNVGTIKSLDANPPVFQNSSGIEKGQLAKAWVKFNGSGTVSINDSFNISSITDNGTGSYTLAFITNMANTNYAAITNTARFSSSGSFATSTFSVVLANINGVAEDRAAIHAIIFGD